MLKNYNYAPMKLQMRGMCNGDDIRETMHDSNQEVELRTRNEKMEDDLVIGDNFVIVCESSPIDESF
jgi:hypothetical protein